MSIKLRLLLSIFLVLFSVSILSAETLDPIVFVTKTGAKYYTATCSYLRSSKIPISLSDALARGYTPCSRCHPPAEVTAPAPVFIPTSGCQQASGGTEELALPFCADPSKIEYYTGFALLYSEEHEQAAWVAYLLTDDEVRGTIERTDDFRSDPNIDTDSASIDDYSGSGFDHGHLAPAADIKWSDIAMSESFYLSNMSPQQPGFNRGIWKRLEEWVRDQAEANGEVYIVTGPVLTDGPYEEIGPNGVDIPKRYYKVILDYKEPEKGDRIHPPE
jgi:DNA/RNA endonuclease G (NUC1)